MLVTLTEALARRELIQNKIAAKNTFVNQNLTRDGGRIDPLEKQGGSVALIAREMQAIRDLERDLSDIMTAIRKANEETRFAVRGVELSLAEWIYMKRSILPARLQRLNVYNKQIQMARQQSSRGREVAVDVIAHIDEAALAREIEETQALLDEMDALLSVKNATVTVEIPD